jgi:orotidine-5'-phosphate decarboxylase
MEKKRFRARDPVCPELRREAGARTNLGRGRRFLGNAATLSQSDQHTPSDARAPPGRYHERMDPSFKARLGQAQALSLLCIGLDPDVRKTPADLQDSAQSLYAFNRRIIDATHDIVAAYKPQIAFYSALGAEDQLTQSIAYIRQRAPQALVILDAKRADIGNTAQAYAREAFDRYGADAVTVNPYMGEDSVRPFLERPERGAIVLCRTSNPGARDFQDLMVDGLPLYRQVARRAAQEWNQHENLMLVVGATYPQEMAQLRQAHPEVPFLVPGIGAQGGDLSATLAAGLNARSTGLLINSSRGIIYAGAGAGAAIRQAALELHTAIEAARLIR